MGNGEWGMGNGELVIGYWLLVIGGALSGASSASVVEGSKGYWLLEAEPPGMYSQAEPGNKTNDNSQITNNK